MSAQSQNKVEESRTTGETAVSVSLLVDGNGQTKIDTGIGFLDHMLTLFCVHGRFDLAVTAKGDTQVDFHHTVEDVGIVVGDAIKKALSLRRGVRRYGSAVIPMDEALASVALDLSNRPYLVFIVPFACPTVGGFDTQLFKEFFRALVTRAGITCHIQVPYGANDHHMIEAVFKAFGRALAVAMEIDPKAPEVFSSKGVL
ncbi:MAG: imidazoleglycerol-phosphate dehydratase HisB [Desulfatibacillaceae bacterium]|nr:imidazoleglycerol-phosphate dehydratase HisB [Desulfatibacillaceae bacterium]